MTTQQTMLDAALAYAVRGWQVIPLHTIDSAGCCTCGKNPCADAGKHPRYDRQLLPNGLKNASSDPGVIQVWWTMWPNANIGLVCGQGSGVWALDIDPRHGGDLEIEGLLNQHGPLPETVHAKTGSGGEHLVFAHPGWPVRNRTNIGPGLDVRGDGGYIVVAPSLHVSGQRYDWILSPDDVDPAPAPRWLLDLIKQPVSQPAQRQASPNGKSQLPKRTLNYLVFGAQNGTRNQELYAAAQQFKAAGYTQIEAEQQLWPRASKDGLDDHEIRRTIDSAYQSVVSGPAQKPPSSASVGGAAAGAPGQQSQAQAGPSSPAKQSDVIIQALKALGYSFRLNLCSDTIEVNGQPLTDVIAAKIRTDARDAGIRPLSAVADAYTVEAAANAYHPIRDYLIGLVWDGQRHIQQLAQYIRCSDPDVVYSDGSRCPLIYVYLWRWLIGAVAKALDAKQNAILVLAGPQGIGKSVLAHWLCSAIPKYFIEAPINVSDKDSAVRLMSHLIWEVSELDATTRKADVAALKDFISKQIVTVRKAYGQHDTVKPALASLIGTVNESTGFLSDDTGNRRFFVATVQQIDWDYQKLDVNQIWAEAFAMYKQGEPWELVGPEKQLQEQQNKQHETETLLEGWIQRYFDISSLTAGQSRMTASEIIDVLRNRYDIRLTGSSHAQAIELARALAHLGVKRYRTGTWRGYIGISPK